MFSQQIKYELSYEAFKREDVAEQFVSVRLNFGTPCILSRDLTYIIQLMNK